MPKLVIVGIDGSEESERAARAGVELLQPISKVVVVAVVEPSDPSLVVGSGFAGGVMSPEELKEVDDAEVAAGRELVVAATAALGIEGAEELVVRGDPGPALCDLAAERSADAIVMGTRGRGGIKRALLGSVSDYVVRNAPCSVVITRPPE